MFRDADLLLKRAGFGGPLHEIEELAALPWEQAVDRAMSTGSAIDPSVGLPDLSSSRGYLRTVDMTSFWLDRAADRRCAFIEKMVLFWHGHFCSSQDKVQDHRAMFEQNQLFRRSGLGDVRQLTHDVALDPAMIKYLDNFRNVAGSPNENFARELMELFTLGVGNYSEKDVRESARAWTGHGLERADRVTYRYRADDHDGGQKEIFGRVGNFDGPDVVRMIFEGAQGRQAARFLATKLWAFFAHPDPSAAVVDVVAAELSKRWIISDAVRAIFLHPDFRSARTRGALVRSPVEHVVAVLMHTGLSAGEAKPHWLLKNMGQEPFRPPDVSGWKQNEYWLSPSSTWAKGRFASNIRAELIDLGHLADTQDLSPEDAAIQALELFGIYGWTTQMRDSVRWFVEQERATSRWAERAGLLTLPMLSPDFQIAGR